MRNWGEAQNIDHAVGLKYACVHALKLYEAFDTTGFGLVKC